MRKIEGERYSVCVCGREIANREGDIDGWERERER